MKLHNYILLSLVMIASGAIPVLAQVSPVESREKLLEKAARLQVVPVGSAATESFAGVPDPFNLPLHTERPVATTLTSAGERTGTGVALSDQAVLQALGELISPTGVMEFGQEVHLLFGERRVKVGDFMSVPYLGRTYRVQVVKADNRAFMLRLNEEFISKRIQ